MFKYLILVCFISYSLQIDNCQETRKQCKTCINGYTAVPLDSYNIKCIKTSEYEAINEVKAHCIKGDPEAKICEKCIRDYFLDEKNNCIEHPHCFKTEGNDCFICYTPYALDKKSLKCVKCLIVIQSKKKNVLIVILIFIQMKKETAQEFQMNIVNMATQTNVLNAKKVIM